MWISRNTITVQTLQKTSLSCVRDIIIYSYLICSVLEGRISIADFTMCFHGGSNTYGYAGKGI